MGGKLAKYFVRLVEILANPGDQTLFLGVFATASDPLHCSGW